MSTQLEYNIAEILRQRDSYLIPENIRADVTVLGITGNMEVGEMTESEYENALELSNQILGSSVTPTMANEIGDILNDIIGVFDVNDSGGSVAEVETVVDDILGVSDDVSGPFPEPDIEPIENAALIVFRDMETNELLELDSEFAVEIRTSYSISSSHVPGSKIYKFYNLDDGIYPLYVEPTEYAHIEGLDTELIKGTVISFKLRRLVPYEHKFVLTENNVPISIHTDYWVEVRNRYGIVIHRESVNNTPHTEVTFDGYDGNYTLRGYVAGYNYIDMVQKTFTKSDAIQQVAVTSNLDTFEYVAILVEDGVPITDAYVTLSDFMSGTSYSTIRDIDSVSGVAKYCALVSPGSYMVEVGGETSFYGTTDITVTGDTTQTIDVKNL